MTRTWCSARSRAAATWARTGKGVWVPVQIVRRPSSSQTAIAARGLEGRRGDVGGGVGGLTSARPRSFRARRRRPPSSLVERPAPPGDCSDRDARGGTARVLSSDGAVGQLPVRSQIGQCEPGFRRAGSDHADQTGGSDDDDPGTGFGGRAVEVPKRRSRRRWPQHGSRARAREAPGPSTNRMAPVTASSAPGGTCAFPAVRHSAGGVTGGFAVRRSRVVASRPAPATGGGRRPRPGAGACRRRAWTGCRRCPRRKGTGPCPPSRGERSRAGVRELLGNKQAQAQCGCPGPRRPCR